MERAATRCLRLVSMDADPKPDWVMVGWRDHEEFCLLASKDMDHADLDAEREVLMSDFLAVRELAVRYDVTAGMSRFMLVVGESYGDCLRHLFEMWSPEPDDSPAIRPAQHREG